MYIFFPLFWGATFFGGWALLLYIVRCVGNVLHKLGWSADAKRIAYALTASSLLAPLIPWPVPMACLIVAFVVQPTFMTTVPLRYAASFAVTLVLCWLYARAKFKPYEVVPEAEATPAALALARSMDETSGFNAALNVDARALGPEVHSYACTWPAIGLPLLLAMVCFVAPWLASFLASEQGVPLAAIAVSIFAGVAALAVAIARACHVIVLYPAHMQVGRFDPQDIRYSDIRRVNRRDGSWGGAIEVRLESGAVIRLARSLRDVGELYAQLESRVDRRHGE